MRTQVLLFSILIFHSMAEEVNRNIAASSDENDTVEISDVDNEVDRSSSNDETEEEGILTTPTRKRKVPSPVWECGWV